MNKLRDAITLTTQGAGTVLSAEYAPEGDTIGVAVDVTAVGGTPTLDVKVEWSPDGATFGDADPTADAMTQITGVTTAAKAFAVKGGVYRISAVVAGTTPSVTGRIQVIETGI